MRINISETNLNRLINQCIDEAKMSLKQEQAFQQWKKLFDSYLYEMIDELQSDYLNDIGLAIHINSSYSFNGGKSRWLAVYERSSRQIKNGIISIGINYPCLYRNMCKRNIENDRFNIEAQARITVGYEIGHGLCDYISNFPIVPANATNCPNCSFIVKNIGSRNEESIVETFGESLFPEATGVYGSIIYDTIEEIERI